MKTLITIVLISSISSTIYASENEDAKHVANTWFLSLMKGEIAVTSALSKTPFSFDSKKIIDSDKQLKELYERIVEDKGKRDIKPTSVEVDKIKDEQKLALGKILVQDYSILIAPPGFGKTAIAAAVVEKRKVNNIISL